jgi:putative hydrolase of the HAD superfamily
MAIQEIIMCLDLYVSSQSCGVRKPNKGGLCEIARIFDVSKSDILFVGDENKDYMTAQNMGCDFAYIKDFLAIFRR